MGRRIADLGFPLPQARQHVPEGVAELGQFAAGPDGRCLRCGALTDSPRVACQLQHRAPEVPGNDQRQQNGENQDSGYQQRDFNRSLVVILERGITADQQHGLDRGGV